MTIAVENNLKKYREQLYSGNHLTFDEMKQFADGVITGQLSDSQLGASLAALKINGVTSEELAAFAEVMQACAIKIPYEKNDAMDNCGTGGDHSNSFNISTTSAFVLAAGGVTMAKHGNRSVSSKSGSADVLEQLGVNINRTPEESAYLLENIGIAFLFAPSLHPGMKTVMKVRQELATPTIFNLIGPLINPIKLSTQLMGTYAGNSVVETATALGKLGRKRALVVHGFGGMDEANLAGETQLTFFHEEKVTSFSLNPEDYGFKTEPLQKIIGGNAQKNAEILIDVLQNKASAYLETVVLNAGLGFYASGVEDSITSGIERARMCLSSGAAYDKLRQLTA